MSRAPHRLTTVTSLLSLLTSCAVMALAPLAARAAAPSAAVHVVAAVSLGDAYGGGVAALGDRYTFAGTSSSRTLAVLDQRASRLMASLALPGLTPYGIVPLKMEMTDLELSPDNRTLYILNQLRQDIVVLDVTGQTAPRAIPIAEDRGRRLVISPDGRYLAVLGGKGATVLKASTGQLIGTVPWAISLAWGPDLTWYVLGINGTRAAVYLYARNGHSLGGVNLPAGTSLTPKTGSVALSPDGRTLYVLWNGLRALALPSLRVTATLRLPPVPAYTGFAVAPNGRQLMLWAPFFSMHVESPSPTPGYVNVTYGWVGGGVQPVQLPSLRPAPADASLRTVSSPQQVAYSGDSARAYVTTLRTVAVLATGTRGADRAPLPAVSLTRMASGPTVHCASYAINGTWSLTFLPGAPAGTGTGQATLTQNGGTLAGRLTLSSLSWTLAGTIAGKNVTLTLSAPGQVASTFHGAISADGSAVVGDIAILRGHATCGSPTGGTSPGQGGSAGGGTSSGRGSGTPPAGGDQGPALGCQAWNVAGTWTLYVAGHDSSGVFNGYTVRAGTGTLTQQGADAVGTFLDVNNGLPYTLRLHGPLVGTAWTVTASAPGQIDLSNPGGIRADGRLIYTPIGDLHGQASCGTGTGTSSSSSGGATSSPPPAPTTGGSTPSCQTWNVAGAWTFTASTTSSVGSGSSTVILSQSGSTVTGSVTVGGVSWTVTGTLQGTTLALTWSAPGQVDQTDSATLAATGATITGAMGTFSGGHATCAH